MRQNSRGRARPPSDSSPAARWTVWSVERTRRDRAGCGREDGTPAGTRPQFGRAANRRSAGRACRDGLVMAGVVVVAETVVGEPKGSREGPAFAVVLVEENLDPSARSPEASRILVSRSWKATRVRTVWRSSGGWSFVSPSLRRPSSKSACSTHRRIAVADGATPSSDGADCAQPEPARPSAPCTPTRTVVRSLPCRHLLVERTPSLCPRHQDNSRVHRANAGQVQTLWAAWTVVITHQRLSKRTEVSTLGSPTAPI